MNPHFRAQYAPRARSLTIPAGSLDKLEREDLYALIGFLLELSEDRAPEVLLAQERPLGSPPGEHIPFSDPPKNDGLLEG